MGTWKNSRAGTLATGAALAAIVGGGGCMGRPVAEVDPTQNASVRYQVVNTAIDRVDVLFEIDNSNSMQANQAQLAAQFRVLIDQLVDPPRDARGERRYPPVRDMHVGVISSDLGTPGASGIGSCNASADVGDDGLLNPVRQGRALRAHQPWTTGREHRPARCTENPDQYPTFLTFDANGTDPEGFREDFVCNAFLSTGGCGLEQQLEAAYRALVTHDARERAGNTSPNAGFLRDDAVLAVVIVSDEEDGSIRDCRYAEPGVPCADATSFYDESDPRWPAAHDLNMRLYLARPGSDQDPTWPLDRYIDPTNPRRGFLGLKPGHPERVIFSAIAGVPIQVPTRDGAVDWARLLGAAPDGADALATASPEGPVSMRPADGDPACVDARAAGCAGGPTHARDPRCYTRVVPACRREGTSHDPARPTCDPAVQYFAWPSRRLAEVARRFAVHNQGNGTISSICQRDYRAALGQIVERIQRQFAVPCLPRPLETTPAAPAPGAPVRVNCVVREALPASVAAASWCTAAHGRAPGGRDDAGRETCLVDQVTVPSGGAAPDGAHGFFYDTRPAPAPATCARRVSFTRGDEPPTGAVAAVECVQAVRAAL